MENVLTFRAYEKVHRLGKDEVDGILEGTVHVEEKIDGANVSIWLDGRDMRLASRNREIVDGFNGFVDYIFANLQGDAIHKLLVEYPDHRLYGEWLVPHTMQYNPEAYKQFYLFDMYDEASHEYEPTTFVRHIGKSFGINTPWHMGTFDSPTVEFLKDFVGKSKLGPKGEGIVIKNDNFLNKWGNRCHAKLVTNEFAEDNGLLFNTNNKAADNYNEMYIVNKWLQKARVDKVCAKLQPEINEPLDLKHIPRITNTVFHDLITEEAWEIAKLNKTVDYKVLKGLVMKKAKLLYMEKLANG